jgi:nickel-dependent lactate racemase
MKNSKEQCLKSADNIKIKYGKKELDLKLSNSVDILSKDIGLPSLNTDNIFDKLEKDSIYSEGISEMIDVSKNILLILPDITRKSGAEVF